MTISRFENSRLFVFAVYLIAGILLFHPIFNTWFLSDDLVIFELISLNPFGYVEGGFFRPLCDFTNYLTWKLFGYDPLPFKVGNLLIHVVNSWLVYLLAKHFLTWNAQNITAWMPVAAGWLFLIWPIHTESIFWGAGRASSLALLWAAFCLIAYLNYRMKGNRLALVWSALAMMAGFFTYESTFTMPLILLLLEGFRPGKGWSFQYMDKKVAALFVGVFGVYLAIRFGITGEILGGYGGNFHGKLNSNILRNLIVFPLKTLVGTGFYDKLWFFGAGAAVGLSGLLLAGIYWKKVLQFPKWVPLVVVIVMVSMMPVLNLSLSVEDTQSDRYLYLPSCFVLFLLAWLTLYSIKKRVFRVLVMLALTAFAVVSTIPQMRNWKHASLLAKELFVSLNEVKVKQGNVLILNLPDHLCGAYIMRNGLREGVKHFVADHEFGGVYALTSAEMKSFEYKTNVGEFEDQMEIMISPEVVSLFPSRLMPKDEQLRIEISKNFASIGPYNSKIKGEYQLFYFNQDSLVHIFEYDAPILPPPLPPTADQPDEHPHDQ